MQTIFTLSSARSGTKYLSGLVAKNARGVASKHEPLPDLFGRPVYWHTHGNEDAVRRRFLWKKWRIDRCRGKVYLETSHSFLKSFCDVAMEFYPDMKLVHLIRDPLKMAKSEARRESGMSAYRHPTRSYRGEDGNRYFRWGLTGKEVIFSEVTLDNLTLFQHHVVQWIEIENRAIQFLDRYEKHADCVALDSPAELQDPEKLAELFEFLGLETRNGGFRSGGRKNRTHAPMAPVTQEFDEFREVVSSVPDEYLEIFSRAPYTRFKWASDRFPS